MAWNTSKTWAAGDALLVGDWNSFMRDDIQFLRDTYNLVAYFSAGPGMSSTLTAWNNGTAAYTNFSNVGTVGTKKFTASALHVRYSLSCYAGAAGMIRVGFAVAGTDYDARAFAFNVALVHEPVVGLIKIAPSVVAAGLISITARMKTSGVFTAYATTDDYACVDIFEVSND